MFGGGNMFEHNYYGFGPILKDYLDYHRISQSDFAKRLGITQKHMNEILNGKQNFIYTQNFLIIMTAISVLVLASLGALISFLFIKVKKLNIRIIRKRK